MRILIRIITLPLAWLLWTISYTYHWIRYGGELQVNIKPIIKPEEFYRLLTEVSERLKDFEAQKEETLHWKRLYENYDLNHCATFVKQQEEIDILQFKLQVANNLTKQIQQGNNIIKSFATMNREQQGFSINSSFNYSSLSFNLSDEEFEIFKTVNIALLEQLVKNKQIKLNSL